MKTWMAQWPRADPTGRAPIPSHNRTIYTGAHKVRPFHRDPRPTVPEGLEDISTKIILLPHQPLGLLTIRNNMGRCNLITVHSSLMLRPAVSVQPISHTYPQLTSQLAASTSQLTEIHLTRHPRLTPRTNLLHHHPDHMSNGMAAASLPRLHQTQDCNMRVLRQSYPIGSKHYLLCQLPNLRLRDRPIHRPLLRPHHSHQVGTRFLRTLPRRPRNPTRKEYQHLGIQGKESLIIRLPCIINYLLYRAIRRTVVRASHLQLSIAGLLV